jgi:hypothetical protein
MLACGTIVTGANGEEDGGAGQKHQRLFSWRTRLNATRSREIQIQLRVA